LGKLFCLAYSFSLINGTLDYAWVRGYWNSITLKRLKEKNITSVYDINSSITAQRKLCGMNSFITRMYEKTRFIGLLYADIVRVHNTRLKNYLISKFGQKIPDMQKKIFVIPIPIRISEYRMKNDFKFRKPSIVFIGGVQKWQGLEYLIKSIGMLDIPEVTLTLYSPPIPKNIVRMIQGERIEDKIERRFISHDALINILPGYDILVIPRPSNEVTNIATPIKMIEAMACGLPIVATDVNGINEYVRHKHHAYLVRPNDPWALAEGIMEVIRDPELAKHIGRQARRLAEEKFDEKVVSTNIENVIEQMH